MAKPFAGAYSFKYHPWAREIHTCNDPEFVVKKAAQTGITEACLNITLHALDQLRLNVFYALPSTTPDAQDFSSARLGKAIELSPYIANMFTRTDRVGLKETATNSLYIRGVKSRSQLKSIDTAVIIADECDEFPEGSVPLLRKRQSGQLQGDKKLIGCSTPSISGIGVDAWYSSSTQEEFFFKCPHCHRSINMTWPDSICIVGETHTDPRIKESYYKCNQCNAKLEQEDKPDFLQSGVWVPQSPGSIIRGFHINGMYSYTIQPWEMVSNYLHGQIDPFYEQEFFNSDLGQAHIVSGAALTDDILSDATGNYKLGALRNVDGLRTMGIDVGNTFHYVVKNWTFPDADKTTFINDSAHGRFIAIGSTEYEDEIERAIALNQPHMIVIDANPEGRTAQRIAARHPGRVFMCYYSKDAKERELNIKPTEISVSVSRTNYLDLTLTRYFQKRCVLPADCPLEMRQHLKNLVRVYKMDKEKNQQKASYRKIGPDHYAHADNYAEIALNLLSQLSDSGSVNPYG
jgi:hypothetical protein